MRKLMSENRLHIVLDPFTGEIISLTGTNDLTYGGTQAGGVPAPTDSDMYFEDGTAFQTVDVTIQLNSGWSLTNVSGSFGTQGSGFSATTSLSAPHLTVVYDGTSPTLGGDYTLNWDMSGAGTNTDSDSNSWQINLVSP